jgi:hypothetical protein
MSKKTGVIRNVGRQLKIDLLPPAMHEWILERRRMGWTYQEIEKESPKAEPWNQVAPEVAARFPGKRLPHTNVLRWHQLRVEQVLRVQQELAAAAHAAAEMVLARGFSNLTESLKNALGETVFKVMNAEGDPEIIAAVLTDAGHLMAKFDRNTIAREKVETENRRVQLLEQEAERKRQQFEQATHEAARKIEKGRALTIEDINRIRERTFGLPPLVPGAAASHPA